MLGLVHRRSNFIEHLEKAGPSSISFVADCGANDGDSVEIVNGPRLVALLALRCPEAADTHYTFDLENSKCPGNFILH
jgi:hypothetical protein